MGLTAFFTIIVLSFFSATAEAKLCNPIKERCYGSGSGSSTKPAYPSKSSSINVNPSAVPTEDALGIEAIVFDGFDFALVKGTGRIGAAISPSNGEETFFGAPGFELPDVYRERKQAKKKFKSQKMTLATSFGVITNKRLGLGRFDVNVGVMAKYNKISKDFLPGAGISGIAGPITFGYSRGKDQYVTDYLPLGVDEKVEENYDTQTISAGIYLNTLAVDYSRLTLKPKQGTANDTNITLITGSLLLKRWILTASHRTEESDRLAYDYTVGGLVSTNKKTAYFGGVQFALTKVLMIGTYYNYYLMNDVAFGATLFF